MLLLQADLPAESLPMSGDEVMLTIASFVTMLVAWGSWQYRTTTVDPIGTVYSWTVIHPAAKTGKAPYALGYVDLDGPVRIFGRLNGKERPAIGDRYRATPDADYGYAFEYAAEENAQ